MARSSTSNANRLVLVGVAAVFGLALVLALAGGDGSDADGFDLDAATAPAIAEGPGTSPVVTADSLLAEGSLTAPVEGTPTLLVFLAHWCPACNAELPELVDWLDAGGLPDGVELRAVATGIDPARDNYPPTTWLEVRDFDAPTLVDSDGSIADAFGLDAFPYWVVVDADGDVVQAGSGQLGAAGFDALAAAAAG